MNRSSVDLPLETYRLAKHAYGTECFICHEPNTCDAELCRKCQAPMALAHQSKTRKFAPQMVAVLGASGVGKTVYLGMLMDMLSRDTTDLQVLARGAFSITLQQTTVSALAGCQFPEKTPSEPDQWNWIHCMVTLAAKQGGGELIMPDMAGEAILEEVDHPNAYPVIRSLLEQCSGALLLVDASQLNEGRHEQEHFAMKVLSFLSELETNDKHGWAKRPIALVFTKADQSEACFDSPEMFARDHAPGIWKHCQDQFTQVNYFASAVAGSCAYRTVLGGHRIRIPLRIEPRGIREPFEWIIEKLKLKKR